MGTQHRSHGCVQVRQTLGVCSAMYLCMEAESTNRFGDSGSWVPLKCPKVLVCFACQRMEGSAQDRYCGALRLQRHCGPSHTVPVAAAPCWWKQKPKCLEGSLGLGSKVPGWGSAKLGLKGGAQLDLRGAHRADTNTCSPSTAAPPLCCHHGYGWPGGGREEEPSYAGSAALSGRMHLEGPQCDLCIPLMERGSMLGCPHVGDTGVCFAIHENTAACVQGSVVSGAAEPGAG